MAEPGATEEPVRVVLADDQALVRAGFRTILESEPGIEVLGEAGDGFAALDLVRRTAPDVVLMDIEMPSLNGLEAARQLLADPAAPEVAVLMLTTYDRNEYVYEALRAGASGFLLKDTAPEQLIDAVRIVAAGDALLAPQITRRLIEQFAGSAPAAPPPQSLDELTAREHEVLLLVARGLSNREIAAELVVSEATVKTHIKRLFSKLRLRDRVQAVVLAYEARLVQPGGV
jgi:DNA-binding NarL/FixJ family response regulator